MRVSRNRKTAAARTGAVLPREREQGQPAPGSPAQPAEGDAPLATVIPLPIFDPFAGADKPW